MKSALLATAVALSLVAVVTDVRATPEDDVAEGTKRMAEAKALFDAKKYEEARLRMLQACAIERTPKCLIGLTLTEYETKRYLDAYTHGREALNSRPFPVLAAPVTKGLQDAIDASYAKIGHLVLDVGPESKVPRAEGDYLVSVDGKWLTYHATEPLHVDVGHHTLEARDGGRVVQREVEAVAGQVIKVSLRAVVEPAEIPSPTLLSHDTPKPSSNARAGVTIGLATLGVGSIVAGAVLGASSSSAYDDVKALMPCTNGACTEAQHRADDAHRSAVWSTVFYGAGAAFLVGAGVTWWLMKPSETSTGARATLVPGPGSVRFTLQY